tara:strand:+ start:2942 stop:3220 length:279 start_codon:yes stop_codon:yes gene_type:complete
MTNLYTFLRNPWTENEELNSSGVKYMRAGLSEALRFAVSKRWSLLVEHKSDQLGNFEMSSVIDVKIHNEKTQEALKRAKRLEFSDEEEMLSK